MKQLLKKDLQVLLSLFLIGVIISTTAISFANGSNDNFLIFDINDEDEEEIEINVDDYIGFFSWVGNATIDGEETPVLTNPEDIDDEEQKIFLNYQHGEIIIHDPKIGVTNIINGLEPTNNIGLELFTLSGIFLISTLAIISFGLIRMKRRKNQ